MNFGMFARFRKLACRSDRIVRCSSGHLYTTMWIWGGSIRPCGSVAVVTSVVLFGHHWAMARLVDPDSLTPRSARPPAPRTTSGYRELRRLAISARKRWLWGLLTASILLALVALAIAALIATVGGNGYALVVLALALAGAYLSGRACARIPNVALRIDPEQVTVVGALRTLHVLTRHAEAFVPEVRRP